MTQKRYVTTEQEDQKHLCSRRFVSKPGFPGKFRVFPIGPIPNGKPCAWDSPAMPTTCRTGGLKSWLAARSPRYGNCWNGYIRDPQTPESLVSKPSPAPGRK